MAVALASMTVPLVVGPSSSADSSASGGGTSVQGTWTWNIVPGTLPPPPLRLGPETLAYTYALDESGHAFGWDLDLGTGLHVTCTRAPRPAPPQTGGRGIVTLHGVPISAGSCEMSHPWRTTLLPALVTVRYAGNLSDSSCEALRTPPWLPYLGGLAVPQASCNAPLLGNLQAWEGQGRFYAHNVVPGEDPEGEVVASAEPWEGRWQWYNVLSDVADVPLELSGSLQFEAAQDPSVGAGAYRWTLELVRPPIALDCIHDPGAGDASGEAFLRFQDAGGVVAGGNCGFALPFRAVANAHIVLPSGICEHPGMDEPCKLTGLRESLDGDGGFAP